MMLFSIIGSGILSPSVSHSVGILLHENLVDPVTARPAAMAGAVSASVGDIDAVMYCPATLGFAADIHVYTGYYWRSLWESWDWHCFQAGIMYPVGDESSFGASFLYFIDDEWTAMDPHGTPLGTVRPYTVLTTLSYGRKFTSHISAGATARFIFDSVPALEPFRLSAASGTALDVSLLARLPIPTLSTAVSLTNLGPELKYPVEYYSSGMLPTTFRVGLGAAPEVNEDCDGYFGLDFSKVFTDEAETSVHSGGELLLFEMFAFRAGYVWDMRDYVGGLTYGAGLVITGLGSVNFASVSNTYTSSRLTKNHVSLDIQLPLALNAAPPED